MSERAPTAPIARSPFYSLLKNSPASIGQRLSSYRAALGLGPYVSAAGAAGRFGSWNVLTAKRLVVKCCPGKVKRYLIAIVRQNVARRPDRHPAILAIAFPSMLTAARFSASMSY
jgi:hypothetical protein